MRYLSIIIACFITCKLQAQALQDINYNYSYSASEKFSFNMKPVRGKDSWIVLMDLQLKDKSDQTDRYSIQLEKRDALSDKQGVPLKNDSLTRISMGTTPDKIHVELTV